MRKIQVKEKHVLCFAVLLLIAYTAYFLWERPIKISEQAIKHNFRLYQKRPSPALLAKEIDRYRPHTTNLPLARKIIAVSTCLGISPYVFTALIAQESAFNPNAVSPTYARGLTQFTSIAVRDVAIALKKGKTSQYFIPIIKHCIRPRLDMKTWSPPYERYQSPIKQKMVLHEEDYALIYGGVFLKMLLARSYERNPHLNIYNHYERALTAYNGDNRMRLYFGESLPEKVLFKRRVMGLARQYASNL